MTRLIALAVILTALSSSPASAFWLHRPKATVVQPIPVKPKPLVEIYTPAPEKHKFPVLGAISAGAGVVKVILMAVSLGLL